MDNANWIENGKVYINGKELKSITDTPWVAHPKFAGVFMKHLFTGADSQNNMSALMVRIEPDRELGDHLHEGKAELHEIVSGAGMATVGKQNVSYFPGVVSFIPADTRHSIKAGDKGMVLLAKFTPPLN